MRKQYGDILAQELADQIHEPVASTTELTAIPADQLVDKMVCAVSASSPKLAVYRSGSTAVVSSTVFVPDHIAASAAYISSPSSAPGRWILMASQNPSIDAMEFTNCADASATGLRAATATVTTTSTAVLLAGGITELNKAPRQIVITTAGSTPADAPATATITGTDAQGNVQTEVVNVAQTATTATSTKFYSGAGLSIAFSVGQGTGATMAIGWGAKLGLLFEPKVRGGAPMILREWSGGSVVTNGTFVVPATDAPFGSYTPNASLDGSTDFVLQAERA